MPVSYTRKNYSPYLHDSHGIHCWTEHRLWVKHSARLPGQVISHPQRSTTSLSLAPFDRLGSERLGSSPNKGHKSSCFCFQTRCRPEQHHCHPPPQSERHTLAKRSSSARLLRNHGNPIINLLWMHNHNDTKQICFLEKRLMTQDIHFTF